LTPDAQMLVTARSRMHLAVQPAAGMCCHTTTHTTSSSSRSRRVLLRCRASSSEPPAQQPEQERQAPSVSQPQPSSPTRVGNGVYSVMAGLAGAGAVETTYLAATKLLNTTAACPTSGCDTVLNSSFGSLFGAPLPLYGAAAYGGVALAAAAAAAAVAAGRPVPGWLDAALAAGVGVLATTSGALMAILHTQLGGAPCVWCYASAGLSAALLAAWLAGMDARQAAATAGPGLGGTVAAAAALYLGFGSSLSGSAAELELTYAQPAVTTPSSDAAVSLAHRLSEAGAKMYGAFWCSHCYDQKQEFGQAAMAEFPYVECFPDGWKKVCRGVRARVGRGCRGLARLAELHSHAAHPRAAAAVVAQGVKLAPACEAAGVKAFPTWVIGGRVSEGQLELSALEALLDETAAAPAAASEAAAVAAAQ
jgi:uncharacterized membrane protein